MDKQVFVRIFTLMVEFTTFFNTLNIMFKRFTIIAAALTVALTLTLSSCTKDTYVDDITPTEKRLTPREGKIILGYSNTTKNPIVAKYNIKIAAAGENNIGFEHVNYTALSPGGHYVEFNAVVNDHSELIIVGDIISIGFEDGECDWCECMNASANQFGDTGGWGMAVAAIVCPECVVVMAAGFAVGCGISALSN